MRRYIDITDIEIPSDENDYDELVAFADAIAEQEMIQLPERKKGKWIDDGTELGCCCSECGVTLDDYFYGALYEVRLDKMPKFCPNCGADMREGDSDEQKTTRTQL